jgi:hypothetical protein
MVELNPEERFMHGEAPELARLALSNVWAL